MLIDFVAADTGIARKACELAIKGFEAASKAYKKVGLSSLDADVQQGYAEACQSRIAELAADSDGDLTGEHALTTEQILALRTGVWLYLEKLTKIEENQTELLVATDDTKAREMAARDLYDRLSGQTRLALDADTTVTFSGDGIGPVTMTRRQFSRAAESLAKR